MHSTHLSIIIIANEATALSLGRAPGTAALRITAANGYFESYAGNRWSAIAARLGADDNSVKNKFYSTLRRGLRKLNKYIEIVRRGRSATHLASNKYLKAEMLVKVNAVVDKTHEQKYEVKQRAIDVA